jgi:hypothetical protein
MSREGQSEVQRHFRRRERRMSNTAIAMAEKMVTAIVESVGLDAFKSLLSGHPLTKDMMIAIERAAGDAAVDTLETEKVGG